MLEFTINIYIIGISCFWTKKYQKEFAGENSLPLPAISFAPQDQSRLPYSYGILKKKLIVYLQPLIKNT